MILHTIIDYSDVFYSSAVNSSVFSYSKIDGGLIEYRNDNSNKKRINRLLTTNPSLYLNKKYNVY